MGLVLICITILTTASSVAAVAISRISPEENIRKFALMISLFSGVSSLMAATVIAGLTGYLPVGKTGAQVSTPTPAISPTVTTPPIEAVPPLQPAALPTLAPTVEVATAPTAEMNKAEEGKIYGILSFSNEYGRAVTFFFDGEDNEDAPASNDTEFSFGAPSPDGIKGHYIVGADESKHDFSYNPKTEGELKEIKIE